MDRNTSRHTAVFALTALFFMIKDLLELHDKLDIAPKRLWYIANNVAGHYKEQKQPKKKFGRYQIDDKGNVRYRDLLVPNYHLRTIQSGILQLLSAVTFPPYMYGCISGRNHIANAFQHRGSKYFLNIDLKDFFSNIHYKKVYAAFTHLNFDADAARLLTKLTTYQNGLPQGAPTSPILANLVVQRTTTLLQQFALRNNLTFTAYLDDFVFSSKHDFKHLSAQIVGIIKSGGFYPSHKKISYRKNKSEITGILIHKYRLDLIPQMKKEIKTNRFALNYYQYVRRTSASLKDQGRGSYCNAVVM